MELEYKRVESVEVNGIRFTCVSKWNGLEEWRDDKNRLMVVFRGGQCTAVAATICMLCLPAMIWLRS